MSQYLWLIVSTAKHVANEVSSMVENMIKEKYHKPIYTSSRNRSDQFSSFFSSRKLAGLGQTELYHLSQNLDLTNKRHEVTRNECQ